MGLDVNHYKLTKFPENKDDFIIFDDNWDIDCNVSIENYREFITDIEDEEIDKDILIIKKEDDYDKILKEGLISEDNIIKVFVGEKHKWIWKQIINDYINENKIKNVWDEIITIGSKDLEFMTVSTYKSVIVKGMYYNEIGYQRKSMCDKFYEIFQNGIYSFYGKKEDFDLAYDCVGGDWYEKNWGIDTVNEIRQYFKENFIDKYEFGKSLLSVSF